MRLFLYLLKNTNKKAVSENGHRSILLKKYVIEKSYTKLKFTLILKEFRFVQRVVGVQRAKPLVASAEAKYFKLTVKGCVAIA